MNRRAKLFLCGALCSAALNATAAEPSSTAAAPVDWTGAQPVASLSVRPMTADEAPAPLQGRDGLYVVEGTIVDLRSGRTLMKPRLFVRRGDEATIEGGVTDGVMMKLTVQIDATADRASTTTEVRDRGVVTGTSSTRFSFART